MHISRFRIRSFFHNEDLAVRLYEKEAPYMARTTMLTLTGISYTYPSMSEPLFEHVSASFQQGWTAVLGDNGLGKTTLLNIAIGMLPADTGSINPDPHGLTIATCPQDNMVRPKNLDDFATDWSPGTMRVRNALHIGDDWPYRYETLSGGETKRLQVACTITARPDVLVLDEPTNHVDGETRKAIVEVMRQYQGIGIVISHDVALVDATCARCVIFERRHTSGRNITAISTYDGGYTQAHELMTSRLRGDEESIRAARQEVTRLRSAQAQRHQAMQSAYARKRNGWKIDRKDHSALDHHKWIEKQTDTASGAAYRQMNKRLERAQRTLDSLTVAAKRYDGDIWIDIRPSNRKELLHLTEGIIIFGSGRMTSSNDAARTPTQSILHADGHQWKVAHNPGMSGEKPRMPGVAIPKLSIGQQDHIGLTGANGLGKTTVMNALLDSMPEDLPHLIVQQQTGEAALSQTMRRLAALQGKERSQVLAAFAQLNADPDKLLSNEAPSPGELRKLMLCLGILDRPQLIVMDEPTNYLDLESKVALARCLADYPGALVVASHDEWFLDQVAR